MLNKATLIGHLGNDPEIKTMQSGDNVCNFSVATSEHWKDKTTGERKERTEWHRVVVFNQALIKPLCAEFLKKGSKVYLEGQIETRNYEKDGSKVYTTEIVLRPFSGQITMLDKKPEEEPQEQRRSSAGHDGGRRQQEAYGRHRGPTPSR